MDVTRFQAPGFLVQQRFLVQVEQQQLIVADTLDPAYEALFIDDELVDVNRRQIVDQLHAVPGAATLLAGIDLAHPVPERAGDRMVALGQQGHVIDQLVGAVVLGRDATGTRLQAHVDVFGDQHNVQVGAPGPYFEQLVDDDVVVEVFRQQLVRLVARGHQDGQEALGPALATLDRHALLDIAGRGVTKCLVDQANGLAAFGGDGLFAGLELVEFLQHRHRDGDMVLLEVQ
ncbi:hypothetical protein D3C78_684570 [compost metagenome]